MKKGNLNLDFFKQQQQQQLQQQQKQQTGHPIKPRKPITIKIAIGTIHSFAYSSKLSVSASSSESI